ncbi:MAG: ABC-F family ATP-binding cassette domain-containing protein [Bacteroidia bacterium]|nr:ABC-F family ATP-binding cassette domain-containing protein [Bacteroidia bacterium]
MNYLTAENLSKSFGANPLFENISLSLSENQKTALIAANGSGKTTLLKILAGKEVSDSGQVVVRKSVTLGYLEQEPQLIENASIRENLFLSDNDTLQLIGDYELALHAGANYINSAGENLADLMHRMDDAGAWDYEAKVTEVMGKLNIHDLQLKIADLSGGQRKRVALAKLLIEEPDLLLLDEPTNHLDLDMIEWLEQYLKRLRKTLLLITHDRYFLDNVCDTILELEDGVMYQYKGNYAYFLEKKEERRAVQYAELDKAQNLYRRELEWMRRQPKARTTKQKARIDSFYETEEKAGKQVGDKRMQISMQMSRMGSKILELENVCKQYGDKVLIKDFSHTFKRGEKLGILGRNGCGKSTLLKMIMEEVKPDKGRIKAGETMVFGYYAQDGLQLKEDKRLIEVAKDICEYVDTGGGSYLPVSQFLQHFNFDYNKQHTYVSKLSGGERRRLHLITVLLKNPNFLILDEPTNDLDIVTLNILEEFLENYHGCLLMVTHDRYFMDRLVDHVFVFTGQGQVRDIHGNYTEYRTLIETEKKEVQANKERTVVSKPAENKTASKKLSYNEVRELAQLEKDLADLEVQKAGLISQMGTPLPHIELQELTKKYEAALLLIETKTMRWLTLAEMA